MRTSLKATLSSLAIAGALIATAVPASAATTLNGGGSSFVANLMNACLVYNDASANVNSDTVSYSSVGSGSGKTNFANNTYKFVRGVPLRVPEGVLDVVLAAGYVESYTVEAQ